MLKVIQAAVIEYMKSFKFKSLSLAHSSEYKIISSITLFDTQIISQPSFINQVSKRKFIKQF